MKRNQAKESKQMTFKEFNQYLQEKLSYQKLPCGVKTRKASIVETRCMNGNVVYEMNVSTKNSNIGVSFGLKEAFELYQDGIAIEDILETIKNNEQFAVAQPFQDYQKDIEKFHEVKNDIECFLISKTDTNGSITGECLKVPMENTNLVTIYVIVVDGNKGRGNGMPVSQKLLDKWNVTVDKLHEIAIANMENKVRYMALERMVFGSGFEVPHKIPEGQEQMLVTNEKMSNGAYSILLPNVAEKIRAHYQDDFYVMPLSTQTMLVVPQKHNYVPDLYRRICKTNKENKAKKCFLADDIYVVEDGKLRSVNTFKALK